MISGHHAPPQVNLSKEPVSHKGETVGDRQAETEVDNSGPYNAQKMAADQSYFEGYYGFNAPCRQGHVSQPQ